jgi:deoxycytidine triphosphate deaminase
MIINPKYILDKGILTLPTNIDIKTVLQPNGIDLQVDKIYELLSNTASVHVGDDIKTVHKKSVELALDKHSHCYELKRLTPYKAETAYTVKLPSDMVAYIFTRSTLNRNGILIGSGLWDSGFEGSVGTTI